MTETDKEMFDPSCYLSGQKPVETNDFIMQQTMMRVKDPKISLDFYCNTLGMHLVHFSHFPQWKFSVYFVGYIDQNTIPTDPNKKWEFCLRTPGCVELTHNYGSENEKGLLYNTGNSDAKGTNDNKPVKGGFGHIGITVPDVYVACQRFKELGVDFHKSPNSGGMKGLAFIKDPDGYLVEVLPQVSPFPTKDVDCNGVALTGGEGYQDNAKAK